MALRVLFFEDEQLLGRELPIALREQGFDLVHVDDANEALGLAESELFACALLDIMTPVPDGWDEESVDYGRTTGVELARRLSATVPSLPIVVLSVVRDEAVRRSLRETGVKLILSKPMSSEDIAKNIHEVLSPREELP